MTNVVVREATAADMESVRRIYRPYVDHSVATFEEEAPATAELARRREGVIAKNLPYLVATLGKDVIGYSYATPYHSRSAYRFTVENSVYVDEGARGKGVGKALLTQLIAHCKDRGLRSMIAIIASRAGDENLPSQRLHQKHGFAKCGTLHGVGFKFGAPVDTVLMELDLKK